MINSELAFFGQITGPFPLFLGTLSVLKKIREGKVPPVRTMCYGAENLSGDFLTALALKLAVNLAEYDLEIYDPTEEFPAHTDGGGTSYMIPLENYCRATINGVTHDLKAWGIYGFDDGRPHATSGGMLMMKEKK